ncbi:MAG: type III-A CRISPR-associated RAMP protein Csm5, partial [Clostridiales bacterium]|nr:type III-A CRISPR-associated RAMP protein Csm5 [Clostridiales bacterium]
IDKKVYIPDIDRFFSYLEKNNLLEYYTNFMLSSKQNLYQWCDEQDIKKDDYDQFIAYSFDAGDAITPEKPLMEIWQFIKDSKGLPYIPGSSLKGALRTAILAKLAASSKSKERHFNNIKDAFYKRSFRREVNNSANKMEQEYLHLLDYKTRQNNAVNSIMKAVSISDSEPIALEKLILCAKIDISRSGKENRLNLTRECIKPGTEIRFKLTLDHTLLKGSCIDLAFIKSAIVEFSNNYSNYVSKFNVDADYVGTKESGKPIIYIGGGVGYKSKTVVSFLTSEKNSLEFTSNLLHKMFPKHYHDKDVRAGVSPHMLKYTLWNGNLMPFGKCSIEIY